MNKLTTKLLSLSGALLLFMAFSASSALAQNYATPNGKSDGAGEPADSFCISVADPCNLATAVQDATDGGASGSTVFVLLPNVGATVTFLESLKDDGGTTAGDAAVDTDMTFSTTFGAAVGVEGIIAVNGDIIIESGVTLSIVEDVEVRLVGQPGRLELNDTAAIDGDGFIGFTATAGDHLIFLGAQGIDCSTPPTPNTGSIRNARIDKPSGDVNVLDECGTDDPSRLNITNRLNVVAGTLNMLDNNLHLTGRSDASGGDDAGVTISGGALIKGSGTVFIEVEEGLEPSALAKSAGAHGYANTHDDCYEIDGDGNMNMAFDKTTNAGVCIDLGEIGAGGFSFNRSGSLFVREAEVLNGSFLNESLAGSGFSATSGARTEFWKLRTITTNLEVVGPGEETLDAFGDFIDEGETGEECETGGDTKGNESGVFFFTPVTVEGDLVMTNTNDSGTSRTNSDGDEDCDEGVWFVGEDDPDDPDDSEEAAAKAAGPADHQPFSTIEGDFSSTTDVAANGVLLDSDDYVHNVAFWGDFIFDGTVNFQLEAPADAFEVGDLCSAYTAEADGNKVRFAGSRDQLLRYPGTLVIETIQVKKTSSNDDVEIHEDSGTFVIATTLEILLGEFTTNGKVDAEGTATVVINRDDDGAGTLEAGDSDRAYLSDDDGDTPRKVKYTGNFPHFTGDELPGDSDGSVEGDEIFLPFLEIFASEDDAVITLGKDFTIGPSSKEGGKLIITRGILDVGSSQIRLSNGLRIEVGDGNIQDPEIIGKRGGFDFPTEWIPLSGGEGGFDRPFDVGDDGIDLLYFGTTDRTVGLEWPPAATGVTPRFTDEDVIRDVTVNPACSGDDIIIALREEDDTFRINGDLIIGGEPFRDSGDREADNASSELGTLDIVGNDLELNAEGDGCCDTSVEVHSGSDLTDSTDELLEAAARLGELAATVEAAMTEYRRTRTDEARVEMNVKIAELRAAQQGISKTASHAGTIRFIGGDDTAFWAATSVGRLRYDFPAFEVDKEAKGEDDEPVLTFDAEGVCSTATGGVTANRPDIIGTSHFTLLNAWAGDDDCIDNDPASGCADAGGVDLLDGLDIFDVGGFYYQYDGEFRMAGVSSLCDAPIKPYIQTVTVGFRFDPGNMVIEDGEFYATGGDVQVFGDFCLGCTPPASNEAASKLADHIGASSGVFSLAVNGTHTIVGDFSVGPDTDPSEQPDQVIALRNRYYLGGECGVLPDKGGVFLNGNYHFNGTGDRFDDLAWLPQEQGLHGNAFFTGANEQFVWHRQDEDAFFCDVVMASRSDDNDGIELQSDVWQNDEGTLTLEHGIIDVGADSSDWIILNTGFEKGLAMRNNSARGDGVVDLGSRDSYINGEVQRRVETGNATGGVITGGYLFPLGQQGEERVDGVVGGRDVDFFRPLILQFPDDLGRSSLARLNYVGARGEPGDASVSKSAIEIKPEDCEWPEGGLVVDAVRSPTGPGGTLTLDVLSNQFWQLEFDRIPSFDPNIRVEADELPNVFDIKSLRLIQWDCDCTNPRLAGLYDLAVGPVDDESAFVNDFIDGVPNLTQEGVDVNDCNIIGIASNFLINQINLPEFPSGLARVQIIHNSSDAGPLDVYIDNNRFLDDALFQTGTPFIPVIGGTHTIDIVAGADADNSNPILSQELTVFNQVNYVIVAHGLINPGAGEPAFRLAVKDNVRLRSTDDDRIDFFFVHGAARLGSIDVRELDPVTNNEVIGLLANNISFDDVGAYLSLDTGVGHNIEITTSNNDQQIDVFRFELQARAGVAGVFAISGRANKAVAGDNTQLTIMGVEASGREFFPALITADEPDAAAELPETFELLGNYPNPFNPSTSISFDLPQTAEVTVEIIDMLGRSVMTLPAKQMEAGAARTVEVNASNLASGAYLYRLIAKTATETLVKTGRMMLIK